MWIVYEEKHLTKDYEMSHEVAQTSNEEDRLRQRVIQ
jgi:hypothetical protein